MDTSPDTPTNIVNRMNVACFTNIRWRCHCCNVALLCAFCPVTRKLRSSKILILKIYLGPDYWWNCSANPMSETTHLHRGRHTPEQVNHESPESAPFPSRATSRQRGTPLSEPDTNLDEVAAPPPISDRFEKSIRHGQYLESQRSPSTQLETEQPVVAVKHDEKSKAERYRSKSLWMTYIVSYLIEHYATDGDREPNFLS